MSNSHGVPACAHEHQVDVLRPGCNNQCWGIPYLLEHGHTGLMVKVIDRAALAREAMRLVEDEGLSKRIVQNRREGIPKCT